MALKLPSSQDLDTLAEKRYLARNTRSRNILQFMPYELEFYQSQWLHAIGEVLLSPESADADPDDLEKAWQSYDELGQAEAARQLDENPYALAGFAIERLRVALETNDLVRRDRVLQDAIILVEHEGLDRFASTLRMIQDDIMRGQRKVGQMPVSLKLVK